MLIGQAQSPIPRWGSVIGRELASPESHGLGTERRLPKKTATLLPGKEMKVLGAGGGGSDVCQDYLFVSGN